MGKAWRHSPRCRENFADESQSNPPTSLHVDSIQKPSPSLPLVGIDRAYPSPDGSGWHCCGTSCYCGEGEVNVGCGEMGGCCGSVDGGEVGASSSHDRVLGTV
jgi:hypothetical protein